MTTSDNEWGPWIEHDGQGCPVPIGTVVNVELSTPSGPRRGVEVITERAKRDWDYIDRTTREEPRYSQFGIVRYRTRKQRGLAMLEDLIATIPENTNET